MTVSTQVTRFVNNFCTDTKSVKEQVVQEVTLNNCVDVHIGDKYVRSNNIIINQNLSVSCEEELPKKCQDALKEELQRSLDSYSFSGTFNTGCKLRSLIVITAFCLSAILIAFTICILRSNNKSSLDMLPKSLDQNEYDYPKRLKFVSRDSWGATPPQVELMNNTLPVERVIFIHTVSSGTCNKYSACKQQVLNIQDLHITNDFGDIGYNFVIGSDGFIYVGAGWDKVGAHTIHHNYGSLGVAFVGDFRTDVPNDLMLSSAKRLLEFGVKINKLSENYQLFGHCQILPSSFPYSPGKNIVNEIKTWHHWNSTNFDKCL